MATYSSNSYLSQSEMEVNARYIYTYFKGQGWTINAISGMLGNMQVESTINPGIWQSLDYGNTSGGLGLVQWTPATNIINWCESRGLDYTAMDSQLQKIMYELENGGQWYATESYNFSFNAFTVSTREPSYLASAFLYNYERAGVLRETERREYAEAWYTYLSGLGFTPRLNENGISGSPYYYSYNPFYQAGYGMPNCTCYAWGRFWEISDINKDYSNRPSLPTNNAGDWYASTTAYEKGTTPRLGAVICWGENSSGDGHVAIVEQILDNGDIVTSNSGWQSTYFWTQTIYKSNGYNISGQAFQGFIYNPFVTEYDPVEPDTPSGDITYLKNKRFNFLLMTAERRRKQWTKTSFYRQLRR